MKSIAHGFSAGPGEARPGEAEVVEAEEEVR